MRKAYTFDDVLLEPRHSKVLPVEVDVSSMGLDIPLISSPMDTVTEHRVAQVLADLGGLGIIHRNMRDLEQAREVEMVDGPVGAAVGVDDTSRATWLINAGATLLCVDSSHGDSENVVKAVAEYKDKFNVPIMAGNVATTGGVRRLVDAGADIIRVGIGAGSICITRVVAGVGVPQLTAIMDCAIEAKKLGVPVVADGGIRWSGDVVKALAAGASAVMIGRLFGESEEAPGSTLVTNGRKLKDYRGMGSLGAVAEGANRYGAKPVAEGVESAVQVQGPLADIVEQLVGGLRSGMGYLGAATIAELQANARWLEVSGHGVAESHPHSVELRRRPPNY